MKRIYVAGLYSSNPDGSTADVIDVLRNIRRGQRVCAMLLDMDYAVFCPWVDYQLGLHGEFSKEVYHANSMAWLEVSEAVLVISGEGLGGGVDAEIRRAKELGIPVFRSMSDLLGA